MLGSLLKVAAGLSILSTSSVLASPIHKNGSALESNKHGAVACESAVCTSIGIDALEKGGNAADAVSYSAMAFNILCILMQYSWLQPNYVLE